MTDYKGDGIGCICHARSSGECACDADWTPSEVLELRETIAHQAAEIERLRDSLRKVTNIASDIKEYQLGWHDDYDEYLEQAKQLLTTNKGE